MGKNRDRESLIRMIVNSVVHEIVAKHTNRSESKHFLESEVIEYRGKTKENAESHNWNNDDKSYIKEKALNRIRERLAKKYYDVKYSEKELLERLEKLMSEVMSGLS